MMRALRLALLSAAIAVAPAMGAVFEPREFTDEVQKGRYRTLIAELRCLVCQNQNLADSDADLAADLRRQVYVMLNEGASDGEIIDFMVARYGDFVLYRPPVRPATLALWYGPAILVGGGLVLLFWQIRRRARRAPATELSESDRRRLRAALDGDGEGR